MACLNYDDVRPRRRDVLCTRRQNEPEGKKHHEEGSLRCCEGRLASTLLATRMPVAVVTISSLLLAGQ